MSASDKIKENSMNEKKPNSKIGVASFYLSLLDVLLAVTMAASLVYMFKTGTTGTYPKSYAHVFGLLVIFMTLIGLVGSGLGIAGLFQKGRSKTYPVVGLVLCSSITILLVGMVILGVALRS